MRLQWCAIGDNDSVSSFNIKVNIRVSIWNKGVANYPIKNVFYLKVKTKHNRFVSDVEFIQKKMKNTWNNFINIFALTWNHFYVPLAISKLMTSQTIAPTICIGYMNAVTKGPAINRTLEHVHFDYKISCNYNIL